MLDWFGNKKLAALEKKLDGYIEALASRPGDDAIEIDHRLFDRTEIEERIKYLERELSFKEGCRNVDEIIKMADELENQVLFKKQNDFSDQRLAGQRDALLWVLGQRGEL